MADDRSGADVIAMLRAEDFEPLVGRDVQIAGTSFTLVLARVDRPRRAVPDGLRAPFSLLFSVPKGATYLPEGLHHCDFGDATTYDIHLAPIHTPSADRQDYEAVFN